MTLYVFAYIASQLLLSCEVGILNASLQVRNQAFIRWICIGLLPRERQYSDLNPGCHFVFSEFVHVHVSIYHVRAHVRAHAPPPDCYRLNVTLLLCFL